MDEPFVEELYGPSAIDRSAVRPWVIAGCFAAVAVLGLYGLYQGFRLTWRDDGPAPHYAQMASAPAAPALAPTVNDDPPAPAKRPKLELAANDAAPPVADGSQAAAITPIVPVDRASLIPAAASAQQGVTFDQPAAASQAAPMPDQSPR